MIKTKNLVILGIVLVVLLGVNLLQKSGHRKATSRSSVVELLPAGVTAEQVARITLGQGGEIAVDEEVLAGVEQIRPALRARIADQEGDKALVVIRADAGLPHALVKQVLEEARLGGATQLGIATRQKGGRS